MNWQGGHGQWQGYGGGPQWPQKPKPRWPIGVAVAAVVGLSVVVGAVSGSRRTREPDKAERESVEGAASKAVKKKASKSKKKRSTTPPVAASEAPQPPPPAPEPVKRNRVKCCDGSFSPTCECGRPSYKGCCSKHGGVCERC